MFLGLVGSLIITATCNLVVILSGFQCRGLNFSFLISKFWTPVPFHINTTLLGS